MHRSLFARERSASADIHAWFIPQRKVLRPETKQHRQ
jgi:hypothetical protein